MKCFHWTPLADIHLWLDATVCMMVHSKSCLVTSETNHGMDLPWNRICLANPADTRKLARTRSVTSSKPALSKTMSTLAFFIPEDLDPWAATSTDQTMLELSTRMKRWRSGRESMGLDFWELSWPAEMDRSHLFPHREIFKTHSKPDYVALSYHKQCNINKVHKRMLKTVATPWQHKLDVIQVTRFSSKLKMWLFKLMAHWIQLESSISTQTRWFS